MEARVIHEIDAAESLQEEWNSLLSNSNATVFQGFRLNIESFKNLLFDKALYVLLFEESNSLKAIFPCYIDASKTLRFINDAHFDFCEPIIDSKVECNKVFKAFAKHIERSEQIKNINFQNLSNPRFLNELNYYFKKRKMIRSEIQHCKVSDYQNWNCLNSLKKSKLKRVKNKFSNATTVRAKQFPKNELNSLMTEMVENGYRKKGFYNDDFINWIENAFNHKILEVWMFQKESKCLGISIHLVEKESRVVWIDFYSSKPYTNIAHYIYFLDQVNEDNLSLGRGTYDYKIKNFNAKPVNLFSFTYSKSNFLFLINESKFLLKYFLKSLKRK